MGRIISKTPMCMMCMYYDRKYPRPGYSCKAFPEGIPLEIVHSETEHLLPVKGQVGDYIFKKEGNYGNT